MILYKKAIHFSVQRFCVLKNTKSNGMTLLETLIALGIFAFMFIFISQFVKQSYRQSSKSKKNIYSTSSLFNIFDLMRQDFQGVGYLLDLNENLNIKFPIEEQDNSSSPADSDFPANGKRDLRNTNNKSSLPVLLSPYFVFEGVDEEMSFTSWSFSPSALDSSSAQWIKVHYQVRDCDSFGEDSSGSCLLRTVSRFWENEKDDNPKETHVLLRGFQSLKFFYSNTEDFLEDDWKDQWKLRDSLSFPGSSLNYPNTMPFPSVVKMEMETEKSKQVFFFPVSSSYLKTWNPYDKSYSDFPKWKPPKKKERLKNPTVGAR